MNDEPLLKTVRRLSDDELIAEFGDKKYNDTGRDVILREMTSRDMQKPRPIDKKMALYSLIAAVAGVAGAVLGLLSLFK